MMTNLINDISFQVHGGGLGGNLANALLQFFDFIDALLSKKPPEMFGFLFPGIVSMENVHPVLVHYPIAFFSSFFVFEVLGLTFKKPQWRYLASWLLYLGVFSAILTVIAGFIAADSVEHDDAVHEIMERHEHFGIAVLSLGLFLSGWRLLGWGIRSMASNLVFCFIAGVLCLVMLFGADLGGEMVYMHGVAVARPAVEIPPAVSAESPPALTGTQSQTNENIAPSTAPSSHDEDHKGHHHSHKHNHNH